MEIKTEKCTRCSGKGTVEKVPYYATIMPEKKASPCPRCYGYKRIMVIPGGIPYRVETPKGGYGRRQEHMAASVLGEN